MTTHRDLKLLPRDHPARNCPLRDIGAEWRAFGNWHEAGEGCRHMTFNELTEKCLAVEWRVPPIESSGLMVGDAQEFTK